MLRLIIGKAGSGKTAAVIDEIRSMVMAKQGGTLYIVPEQYSHEAERELCAACGDTLSLYAEVFSFTGLSRRIMSRQGGFAAEYLDKGGRLLCMALALSRVSSRLKVYSAAGRKAELQVMLLRAIDELRSACVSTDSLYSAAADCPGSLGDKLEDLALISEAYDAVVSNGHADPSDRLTVLARQIEDSSLDRNSHVYVDGFTDFTRQEQEVLAALLRRRVQLTVCLTVDELHGSSEVYALSRRAAFSLIAAAGELGEEADILRLDGEDGPPSPVELFADELFSYSRVACAAGTDSIRLYSAGSVQSECELAAASALELVRDKGLRWRDIAVAVRGFEDYRESLETAFRFYGVPLFVTKKSDLPDRPLPALISLAYEIIDGGWDVDDVTGYMRTALTGLSSDECDILEGYIFKWQLRSGAWLRSDDWKQHPDGYGMEYDDDARERLARINALRRTLADPLIAFSRESEEAHTAREQAAALAMLFQRLELPSRLQERSRLLERSGRETLAAEYRQLWELTVGALEQCCAILGDMEMDRAFFGRLFISMLSMYDIGSIPVSLDRVSAGDFDRMRRRHIRYLIVLGASDSRLPQAQSEAGVFSDEERSRLSELDIDLGSGESELWREFSVIYSCLSLPSDGMIMSYPAVDGEGGEQRPSFVMSRAQALFSLDIVPADMSCFRLASRGSALALAAQSIHGGGGRELAAMEYLRRADPERAESLEAAARMTRGRLSPAAVDALYGTRPRLSASRIDKFASCKFSYFCQYGLKARPHEPASFKPPEIGTFMHYVLENVAREVKAAGGFRQVGDAALSKLCDKYVQEYIKRELNDFQEKSRRFRYLFTRLTGDVRQIVQDMAEELRRSDFEPLDFELNFADARQIRPIELGGSGGEITLTGIADRVDGWLHDGKLYLRVVDYKTGKKKFSMSDVWYGMGLQMLLYLFALESSGSELYGREIVPAGVMYVPARNALLSLTEDADDGTLSAKHSEARRRSGLVLDNRELMEAWENGGDKRYIPVKFKNGEPGAEAVASLERLGLISRHIGESLSDMAEQLHRGNIAADPFYRSQQENACVNCDYYGICHFTEGRGGEKCRYMPTLSAKRVWELLEGDGKNG